MQLGFFKETRHGGDAASVEERVAGYIFVQTASVPGLAGNTFQGAFKKRKRDVVKRGKRGQERSYRAVFVALQSRTVVNQGNGARALQFSSAAPASQRSDNLHRPACASGRADFHVVRQAPSRRPDFYLSARVGLA